MADSAAPRNAAPFFVCDEFEIYSDGGGPAGCPHRFREAIHIKTVNVKSDMPSVNEALERLEREIALARREKSVLLKIIHGYGSSGAGGDIRVAVQRRLREFVEAGQIRGCIFGEDWGKGDEATWKLLRERPELKDDPHLGRRNLGITIVVL